MFNCCSRQSLCIDRIMTLPPSLKIPFLGNVQTNQIYCTVCTYKRLIVPMKDSENNFSSIDVHELYIEKLQYNACFQGKMFIFLKLPDCRSEAVIIWTYFSLSTELFKYVFC